MLDKYMPLKNVTVFSRFSQTKIFHAFNCKCDNMLLSFVIKQQNYP